LNVVLEILRTEFDLKYGGIDDISPYPAKKTFSAISPIAYK
jgi:hypothetical protein